jgi:hypothetical protein
MGSAAGGCFRTLTGRSNYVQESAEQRELDNSGQHSPSRMSARAEDLRRTRVESHCDEPQCEIGHPGKTSREGNYSG